MTKRSPFRYFKMSPEIIRLAVVMYVRFPLSLRNVEDLLLERVIYINYETVLICLFLCRCQCSMAETRFVEAVVVFKYSDLN